MQENHSDSEDEMGVGSLALDPIWVMPWCTPDGPDFPMPRWLNILEP